METKQITHLEMKNVASCIELGADIDEIWHIDTYA